jgi:hypothetical protein
VFGALPDSLAAAGQAAQAQGVAERMQAQGLPFSASTGTALLRAAGAGGDWRACLEAMHCMQQDPLVAVDLLAYNHLLAALAKVQPSP